MPENDSKYVFNINVFHCLGQTTTRKTADCLIKSLDQKSDPSKHINSLIKLAEFQVLKPGELKTDMDSALTYLKSAQLENNLLKDAAFNGYINTVKSQVYRESGNAAFGKKIINDAILSLKKAKNYLFLGNAYTELANYYSLDITEIQQKIAAVKQAQQAYETGALEERNAFTLKVIGDLYLTIPDAENGLLFLNRALIIYQKIHFPYMHPLYILMGAAYLTKADYKQALYFQLLALKNAEKVNDRSMQYCEINNHIGLTYVALKQEKAATPYFLSALATAKAFNDIGSIYVVTENLFTVYSHTGQYEIALKSLDDLTGKYSIPDRQSEIRIPVSYVNVFLKLKSYRRALPYVKKLDHMIKTLSISEHELVEMNLCIGGYYTATKQFTLAVKYMKEATLHADKNNQPIYKLPVYNYWFQLDTARKDYQSAVNHLLIKNKLDDSLYNLSKSRQIQQLEVAYQTEKKENAIKVLQTTDKLHQQELAESIRSKRFYVIGIILLLMLLGVGYSRFRIKQKHNALLEIQQKDIKNKNLELEHLLLENSWLLREVHHRVKNNLQLVMSLLNSQSRFLKDDAALTAVKDSKHRVQAMSLIHQKLYKTDNYSSIYMPDYVNDLLDYIRDSFRVKNKIIFIRNIVAFHLDVLQAVPLGLILNEAVTNAIKYAFPQKTGVERIEITLKHDTAESLTLIISDNGIGIPGATDQSLSGSFGMTLMYGLAADLDGKLTVSNTSGTTVRLDFKKQITISDRKPGNVEREEPGTPFTAPS